MNPKLSGKANAAKLGVILAAAWALIFAGCLMNVKDPLSAFTLAVIISLVVAGLMFSAGRWVPQLLEALKREDES